MLNVGLRGDRVCLEGLISIRRAGLNGFLSN